MYLPKDPDILLSYVNMKLRDMYDSLEDLCDDADVPAEEIEGPLNAAGYFYDPEHNCFR